MTEKQALLELHELLATKLKYLITQPYFDKDGLEVSTPASVLNVVRQFLKDNNIEVYPTACESITDLCDVPEFEDPNIICLKQKIRCIKRASQG